MMTKNIELRTHLYRIFGSLMALAVTGLIHFLIVPVLPEMVIGGYDLHLIGGIAAQIAAVVLLGWMFWEFRFLIDHASVLVATAGVSKAGIQKYSEIVAKTLYIVEIFMGWSVIVILLNNILRLFQIPSNIILLSNNVLSLVAISAIIYLVYRIAVTFLREVKTEPTPILTPQTALVDRLMAERFEIERSLNSLETRIKLIDADHHIGLLSKENHDRRMAELEDARQQERKRMVLIDERLRKLRTPPEIVQSV